MIFKVWPDGMIWTEIDEPLPEDYSDDYVHVDIPDEGCQGNSCFVQKPVGAGHNGPCSCLPKKPLYVRRAIIEWLAENG